MGFKTISLLLLLTIVKTSSSEDNTTLSILVNGVKAVDSVRVVEHADIKVECFTTVRSPPTMQLSLMVDAQQLSSNSTNYNNLTGNMYVSAEKKNTLRTNTKLLCSSLENGNPHLTTSVQLDVMYPPSCSIAEIVGKKSDRYLSCDCKANPSAKLFWFAANDKIIYNSTGKRISVDRIYPGATNITCSANNGIQGEDPPGVLIIPSNQGSRRSVRVIVGVVLSAFYIFILTVITLRYRKQRKRRYVKSSTVEL